MLRRIKRVEKILELKEKWGVEAVKWRVRK